MPRFKLPSIAAIAEQLRSIQESVGYLEPCPCSGESHIDVRLQVWDDSSWAVHSGLPDYAQDHRGYWGASSIPSARKNGKPHRFNARAVARELIEQAADHAASNGENV